MPHASGARSGCNAIALLVAAASGCNAIALLVAAASSSRHQLLQVCLIQHYACQVSRMGPQAETGCSKSKHVKRRSQIREDATLPTAEPARRRGQTDTSWNKLCSIQQGMACIKPSHLGAGGASMRHPFGNRPATFMAAPGSAHGCTSHNVTDT